MNNIQNTSVYNRVGEFYKETGVLKGLVAVRSDENAKTSKIL